MTTRQPTVRKDESTSICHPPIRQCHALSFIALDCHEQTGKEALSPLLLIPQTHVLLTPPEAYSPPLHSTPASYPPAAPHT